LRSSFFLCFLEGNDRGYGLEAYCKVHTGHKDWAVKESDR